MFFHRFGLFVFRSVCLYDYSKRYHNHHHHHHLLIYFMVEYLHEIIGRGTHFTWTRSNRLKFGRALNSGIIINFAFD